MISGIRAAISFGAFDAKSQTSVVSGITEHEYAQPSLFLRLSKPFSNQRRADALFLKGRMNCNRCKPKRFHWRFKLAEQNVANYPVISFGHQRNDGIAPLSKIIDEFGFVRSTESQAVNLPDGIMIIAGFTSNNIFRQKMPISPMLFRHFYLKLLTKRPHI